MSGIIDMQQSNLKPNQRFFPGEPEEYQAINLIPSFCRQIVFPVFTNAKYNRYNPTGDKK